MNKPKPKCKHGHPAVCLEGCAQCVTSMMEASKTLEWFGMTGRELFHLLRNQWKTSDELRAAIEAAKESAAAAAEARATEATTP